MQKRHREVECWTLIFPFRHIFRYTPDYLLRKRRPSNCAIQARHSLDLCDAAPDQLGGFGNGHADVVKTDDVQGQGFDRCTALPACDFDPYQLSLLSGFVVVTFGRGSGRKSISGTASPIAR